VLIIIVVAALTLLISTLLSIWLSSFNNLRIPSIGTIRIVGIEAYGGNITTQDGEQIIDWGTVYPGAHVNRSLYINNSKSNTAIILSLTLSNLTFLNSRGENVTGSLPNGIENPLNLTWNYSGAPLNPREEIYVILTLDVSSSSSFLDYLITYDVREFGFEIAVKAIEH
jgi:hypothetical protein